MSTDGLNLVVIQAAQAQKEVTANGNFGIIDSSAKATSVAIVNGTNNLSEANSQYELIILTGAITATVTVVIPSTILKVTRFLNHATGDFSVTIKHSGQTGVVIKYGEVVTLFPTMLETDRRNYYSRLSIAMTTANYTATDLECSVDRIVLTGAIGANRNFIVTTPIQKWSFLNNTSGGFDVTVKTSAGTGIVVANGKTAILESDGTNILRLTPDV